MLARAPVRARVSVGARVGCIDGQLFDPPLGVLLLSKVDQTILAWTSVLYKLTNAEHNHLQPYLPGTKGSLEIHNANDMAKRVRVKNPAQVFPITGLGS